MNAHRSIDPTPIPAPPADPSIDVCVCAPPSSACLHFPLVVVAAPRCPSTHSTRFNPKPSPPPQVARSLIPAPQPRMGTTESTMGGGKGVNKGPFSDAEYALVVQVCMYLCMPAHGVCVYGLKDQVHCVPLKTNQSINQPIDPTIHPTHTKTPVPTHPHTPQQVFNAHRDAKTGRIPKEGVARLFHVRTAPGLGPGLFRAFKAMPVFDVSPCVR